MAASGARREAAFLAFSAEFQRNGYVFVLQISYNQ